MKIIFLSQWGDVLKKILACLGILINFVEGSPSYPLPGRLLSKTYFIVVQLILIKFLLKPLGSKSWVSVAILRAYKWRSCLNQYPSPSTQKKKNKKKLSSLRRQKRAEKKQMKRTSFGIEIKQVEIFF